MNLFDNQSWNELSRPVRWGKSIRPAKEVLEARRPALLGVGGWLYRNVSWSDLQRIGEPGEYPPCWGRMAVDVNSWFLQPGTAWHPAERVRRQCSVQKGLEDGLQRRRGISLCCLCH